MALGKSALVLFATSLHPTVHYLLRADNNALDFPRLPRVRRFCERAVLSDS